MLRDGAFDYKKATQTLNFLARKFADNKIDKMKALKLIWLADRYHVRKYGRTVTGDKYYAVEWGPIPSAIKDVADKTDFIGSKEKEYSESLIRKINNKTIESLSVPDLDVFSDSDIEALTFAFDNFGHLQPMKLSEISHEFPEWKKYEATLKSSHSSRVDIPISDFFENGSYIEENKFDIDPELLELNRELFIPS